MGRPSLKEQRSAEILDAFARCVARFGIEGSTLERIAEEAGVKRTILRHYIGNREALVDALGARIEREYLAETEALFQALPETDRIDTLLRYLFDPTYYADLEGAAVAQALISSADTYPDIAERMRGWIKRFDDLLAAELARAYPKADKADVRAASFSVMSLYFNVSTLAPLALPKRYNDAALRGAEKLIRSLAG